MKILCIVQARMGSERLPGKVIKPLLGKPMIIYTLDRLAKSKYIDEVVLATSKEEKEQPLVEVLQTAGYKFFRGNEKNVLKRYRDAAEEFRGDIIIRVTGDCPFIDSKIVDNVITYFRMNDYDYVRLDVPNSFVRGFDVEIFTKEALDEAYNAIINFSKIEDSNGKFDNEDIQKFNMYKEHVTYYMYKHPEQFKIGYVKGSELYNKNYRLCVDTKEDFQLVENIFNHFKDEFVSSKDVIKYLDNNPEISRINENVIQK